MVSPLATVVLFLHLALVLFVVLGLPLIWVGNARGWRWVNAWWFRALHSLTMAVVVAQAWLGIECPLTTLENWLRAQSGARGYAGGFIEHWMRTLLFWSAPPWVFTALYTGFGALVAFTWWRFPPTRATAGRTKT
jgi:hypothetical protein